MAAQNDIITRHPVGRPTDYHPKFALIVRGFGCLGATDVQIADSLGVHLNTFRRWCEAHEEFRESLNEGRNWSNANVAGTLYRRAIGYDYEEEKLTKEGEIVTLRRHMPGDVTAQIFWLKNRRPDLWRDQKNVELTGANGGAVKIEVGKLESVVIDADYEDATTQDSRDGRRRLSADGAPSAEAPPETGEV